MAQFEATLSEHVALVDAVDHLLNRGVVLAGQTTLSLAGVDLVYLGINLLLTSVQTLEERRREGPDTDTRSTTAGPRPSGGFGPRPAILPSTEAVTYSDVRSTAQESASDVLPLVGLPEQTAGDAGERPERGLARLVLTLVELLRQIMERQAVRRMEGESLAEEAVERMGVALMELETKMIELREVFGLSEADLNLDLGPLGRLLDDGR